MRTYDKDYFGPLDQWDRVFGDMRCGEVKPGDRVRMWDDDDCRFRIGIAEFFCGEPSVRFPVSMREDIENYRPIKWDDVTEGQEVFLTGHHRKDGELLPVVYGPHRVHSVSERKLRSSRKGNGSFMHYAEELVVKK